MKGRGRGIAGSGLQERRSSDNNNNLPAYPGSRFDANGFCIVHDTVRLCKVTNNVGKFTKYQILQKVCPECARRPEVTRKVLPQQLHGAKLPLCSDQNPPKATPPTQNTRQSNLRRKSRSQERFRERGSSNLFHPPTPTPRRRRSQSQTQPRKLAVRKQLPKPREGHKTSSSKLVNEIIEQITILPPPPAKDITTASTSKCTTSQSSISQSLNTSTSTDFKQQMSDISGLLHSIHMNDSADKLMSAIDIDMPTQTQTHSQSQSQSKKQVKSYNTIRDDASAKYLFRKGKRDQSSSRNQRGEKVVAFKQYLDSVPVSSSSKGKDEDEDEEM